MENKTKEELSEEYVKRRFGSERKHYSESVVACGEAYEDGFDKGFMRAVELLRSQEATEFENGCEGFTDNGIYADWLEKKK